MFDQLRKYYAGKTVLVTGHTGFKGSWLSLWLIEFGANVVGYALDPDNNDGIFSLVGLTNDLIDIRGDIRDFDSLSKVMQQHQPDVVFHLAAQALVGESYENPEETYSVNIMGTLNLLQLLRQLEKKVEVVVVTTDKVYRNDENQRAFIETDPLGGYDPYSSSKACSDILVDSWRYSFFPIDNYNNHKKCLSTARAGNVIGGGDRAKNRLLPDVFNAIKFSTTLEIRSRNSVRPWQHVLEPVYGYLLLAYKMNENPLTYGTSWNFGPDTTQLYSVESIISLLTDKLPALKVSYIDNVIKETKFLMIDSTKALEQLGWNSLMNVDETLELIVEWESHSKEDNIKSITRNQILKYAQRITEIARLKL
jgi:CDP-glucose 4,6-dehydratase